MTSAPPAYLVPIKVEAARRERNGKGVWGAQRVSNPYWHIHSVPCCRYTMGTMKREVFRAGVETTGGASRRKPSSIARQSMTPSNVPRLEGRTGRGDSDGRLPRRRDGGPFRIEGTRSSSPESSLTAGSAGHRRFRHFALRTVPKKRPDRDIRDCSTPVELRTSSKVPSAIQERSRRPRLGGPSPVCRRAGLSGLPAESLLPGGPEARPMGFDCGRRTSAV